MKLSPMPLRLLRIVGQPLVVGKTGLARMLAGMPLRSAIGVSVLAVLEACGGGDRPETGSPAMTVVDGANRNPEEKFALVASVTVKAAAVLAGDDGAGAAVGDDVSGSLEHLRGPGQPRRASDKSALKFVGLSATSGRHVAIPCTERTGWAMAGVPSVISEGLAGRSSTAP